MHQLHKPLEVHARHVVRGLAVPAGLVTELVGAVEIPEDVHQAFAFNQALALIRTPVALHHIQQILGVYPPSVANPGEALKLALQVMQVHAAVLGAGGALALGRVIQPGAARLRLQLHAPRGALGTDLRRRPGCRRRHGHGGGDRGRGRSRGPEFGVLARELRVAAAEAQDLRLWFPLVLLAPPALWLHRRLLQRPRQAADSIQATANLCHQPVQLLVHGQQSWSKLHSQRLMKPVASARCLGQLLHAKGQGKLLVHGSGRAA
mmetsp:Transcript_147355/g.410501  ORF Transcript_147355/g.410501 Transcript_147355/m.410501 type:complete len:263 (-) Transcript_147355:168-956(-)